METPEFREALVPVGLKKEDRIPVTSPCFALWGQTSSVSVCSFSSSVFLHVFFLTALALFRYDLLFSYA